MKKILFGLLIIATIVLGGCSTIEITNFEECVAAGNPVMQSLPQKCSANGQTFIQEIESNITNYEECVAAGFPVMESYPEQCAAFGETFTREIEPAKCTREYVPVCGEVEVQCVTTPCNPINQTFSNKCMAEAAGATNIVDGACEEKEVNLKGACLSFDGIWHEEFQECEGMSQIMCEDLGGTFNECDSACRHDPDAVVCTLQCIQTCTFE